MGILKCALLMPQVGDLVFIDANADCNRTNKRGFGQQIAATIVFIREQSIGTRYSLVDEGGFRCVANRSDFDWRA